MSAHDGLEKLRRISYENFAREKEIAACVVVVVVVLPNAVRFYLQGPGQICGGPSEAWGVCGDGLICNCNRCAGCSLASLECFTNPCLPHQSLESRGHLELLDRYGPVDRIAK